MSSRLCSFNLYGVGRLRVPTSYHFHGARTKNKTVTSYPEHTAVSAAVKLLVLRVFT